MRVVCKGSVVSSRRVECQPPSPEALSVDDLLVDVSAMYWHSIELETPGLSEDALFSLPLRSPIPLNTEVTVTVDLGEPPL